MARDGLSFGSSAGASVHFPSGDRQAITHRLVRSTSAAAPVVPPCRRSDPLSVNRPQRPVAVSERSPVEATSRIRPPVRSLSGVRRLPWVYVDCKRIPDLINCPLGSA